MQLHLFLTSSLLLLQQGLCQDAWPASLIRFSSTEAQQKRKEARDKIQKQQDEFHEELEEKRQRLDKELQDQAQEEKALEDEVRKLQKASKKAAKEKASKDHSVNLLELDSVQVGSFTLFFVPSLILLAWLRRNHCETSDVDLGDYVRQEDLIQVA